MSDMTREYVGGYGFDGEPELTGEEIVRCRDCDFSHEDELGNLRCHGPLTEPWDYYNDEPSDGVKVEPSGFCAWAKLKEGGDE